MDLAHVLIEQNPDGVVGFDREFRYTIWNPAMERLTGMRREQVIGRDAFDVFPFLREIGEDVYFTEALAGRTAVSRDRRFRIPETGHIGYFEGHYLPVRDASGAVVGGIGLIRDLTARYEAEARARESRELFESYMAHIPGVAFVKDSDGRHVFANRLFEQAHGLAPGQWRGKLDADIFPPDTAARFRSDDLEVLAGGEPVRMVDAHGARNEPEHWMWVKFPLLDARGNRLVAGVAFNITDQHRAEQALRESEERFRRLSAELQEADRHKDEFLATLGHELRNPLAPLITAAELLRITGASDSATQRAVDVIGRQAQQMRRLIDDMLDVTRIRRGIVSLQIARIDLRSVLHEAVRAAQTWVNARGQTLAVEFPATPVHVDADRVRIEQIVTNLLSNAAKFTPGGGRISVTLACHDGAAVVRVADTGKGIPDHMLSRVFDLFTQVNPAADRAEGGLGLGLTLVKRLTEMHGGTVAVSSAGEGQGTEFTVRLPLQDPPDTGPSSATRETVPSTPDTGCGVLIVDDNADAAEMLDLLLPGWGYRTMIARSGGEAIELAKRLMPDVILLDIGLPDLDGFEVARQIRAEPSLARTAVVALTGFGQAEDRRRTHESGFAAHLTKPVEMETLRALLASLCEQRRA